jgi:glyoxylase-like metal-dependent hydrolase (beta-lactamase superfamily II)
MSAQSLRVGDLEIIPIPDGHFTIPQPSQIKVDDESQFAVHRGYIPGDGTFVSQLGAFLVRTGGRTVLIDAGLGPPCGHCGVYHADQADPALLDAFDNMWRRFGRDEEFVRMRRRNLGKTIVVHGKLPTNLRAVGVDPAEVTDVILSHLHCDHVGWVTHEGAPFFPNAAVWCHEADIAHFLGDAPPDETGVKVMFGVSSTKERISGAVSRLRPWASDFTVAPGIDVRHLPGHTPGSSIAIVSSGSERAMITGDVIHCPLELTDDDFSIMADLDPALAHRAKLAVIRETEDGRTHIASTHFPEMQFGRLLKAEGRRYWTWS